METWVIILIVVGVLVVVCVGYVISTQRSLVSLDEFCSCKEASKTVQEVTAARNDCCKEG